MTSESTAAIMSRITEVLDSTYYTRQGFTIEQANGEAPAIIIIPSVSPEYRFIINPQQNGSFTTVESPGRQSDAPETFERPDFETCSNAIKQWSERISKRQGDWILDEFGGVADSDPAYFK